MSVYKISSRSSYPPFNKYGELKRASCFLKWTTFLWRQWSHWSFPKKKKKQFKIRAITPHSDLQQSMSDNTLKMFKIGNKWKHCYAEAYSMASTYIFWHQNIWRIFTNSVDIKKDDVNHREGHHLQMLRGPLHL